MQALESSQQKKGVNDFIAKYMFGNSQEENEDRKVDRKGPWLSSTAMALETLGDATATL